MERGKIAPDGMYHNHIIEQIRVGLFMIFGHDNQSHLKTSPILILLKELCFKGVVLWNFLKWR